jgi:apolipoprotein N-acyltransferase
LLEWTRSWFLTGFSWLSIGYSQIDSPLAAWAPIVGVHGVSWVTVFVAGLIPWALRGDRIIRASAAGVCVLVIGVSALLLSHAWTQSTGGDLKIALIQGAIPQELKWLREQRLPTLETYGRMTLDLEHQDLIIWPEVAIPALPEQVEPFLDGMRKRMVERHSQLFAGILTYDTVRDQYRNTLLSLGDPPGEYHKRHLVPFGEYFPVPGFVRELMRLMNLPYETTSAGDRHQAPLMLQDIAVAPSICYEVAFGAEQLDFLPVAGLLVNVSNDAWFGNSIAPHQHLQMARMRALEAGRYMLRATNTGITAVVGPDGRLRESIPQFKRAVLTAIVHAYTGATPYVRTGNWAIVCLSMLVLLPAGLVRIRGG